MVEEINVAQDLGIFKIKSIRAATETQITRNRDGKFLPYLVFQVQQ